MFTLFSLRELLMSLGFFVQFFAEQEGWATFNDVPPPPPPMSSNPGHEDYLSPRAAPRKPPVVPKPYAASKSEKSTAATAAASESKISFCECNAFVPVL